MKFVAILGFGLLTALGGGPIYGQTAAAGRAQLEATFSPGMKAAVHRHSAWYLLTGAECLETPAGMTVAHAGDSAIVPEGPPMALSGVGTETRRPVLLVLHDTTQPWVTMTMPGDWQPKGLCP
jgi:hypothetical protein